MEKIAIIKLGALGDVVRTLPIAEALKKKFPNSKITWATKRNALEIFENNPFVDEVFAIPFETDEKIDILYNFDIEDEATELVLKLEAERKLGFYSEGKYPAAFNLGAEYYLNTLFDDELKKKNKKTYQEMMFQAAELSYENILPVIYLNEKEKKFGQDFMKKNEIETKKIVGVHIGGGGSRWPSKEWPDGKIVELVEKIKKRDYEVIIFGGPDEVERISLIENKLKEKNIDFYINDPKNTIREFASLINICDRVVCMDSFSLHMATALKKSTIALFFCTSPDEIEDYGLVKKIASPMLKEFFPEKMDLYDERLVNSISSDEVFRALEI